MKWLSLLLLLTGLITGTSAATNSPGFNFEFLEKGQPAPADISYLREEPFKVFEVWEIKARGAVDNQDRWKQLDKDSQKKIGRFTIKIVLNTTGALSMAAGSVMFVTGDSDLKKWGAGLMGGGALILGAGIAF